MNTAQTVHLTAILTVALFALSFTVSAHADFTVSASDSAFVLEGGGILAAGPRSGPAGKQHFNIEGSTDGVFASFGVLDFLPPSGATISMAQTLQLNLTEVDAAFTHAGTLNFYLTSDTTTDIQPGTSPLAFQSGSLPDGLSTQLTPNYLLGSQPFNSSGSMNNGQVDTYSFALSGAAQTYLTDEINAGGDIRLMVTPGDGTIAATFAGVSYANSNAQPGLTVTDVPEPSSFLTLLVAMPMIAVGLRTRRKR